MSGRTSSAAEREGRFGVVAIVAAQEFQWVFSAKKPLATPGRVWFDFAKTERRVGIYYFYVLDPEFGPGFIKICTYFPYPAKVWRERARVGQTPGRREPDLTYRAWPTASPSCEHPERLQAICDRFGPDDVQGFFDRWITVIPTPFTEPTGPPATGGSCRCAKSRCPAPWSSTTLAGPGASSRPSSPTTSASAVPKRSPWSSPARSARPPKNRSATGSSPPGTEVKMDFAYKHSRVKQYLKEGRALRIETVINKPSDLGLLARLEHLPELIAKARAGQRSSAYDRTCRSGLCHRLCAL